MNSGAVAAALLQQAGEVRARLERFIALPSVSTDPLYAEGMRGAQRFLLDWLNEIGLQDVQMLDGGSHPAIYGAWLEAPGKPTVLIYGHYDVQPPDPLEEWLSPPFSPTERDGCLFGRGASDDKGSSVIAIAAVAAFLRQRVPARSMSSCSWKAKRRLVAQLCRRSSRATATCCGRMPCFPPMAGGLAQRFRPSTLAPEATPAWRSC